jgi:hypothetical protein
LFFSLLIVTLVEPMPAAMSCAVLELGKNLGSVGEVDESATSCFTSLPNDITRSFDVSA